MSVQRLQPGDKVSHPVYGLGVIEQVTWLDQDSQATEVYNIRISRQAMLTVPVERAEAIGLRLAVNGMAQIARCLRAAAQPLPSDARERMTELHTRGQAVRSDSLARTVCDLLGHGRTYRLTPADKRWLQQACDRLSSEAALVDSIDPFKARALIQQEVDLIRAGAA